VLANNHVLDWGRSEVATTLAALRGARLATAGAGPDEAAATAPAVLRTGGGQRVLLFAVGHRSSGIPAAWAAGPGRPGVAYLPALDGPARDALVAHIRSHREPDDLVILSVHWGDNWGWEIPAAHRDFAHAMVEQAGVDLVHGHSSHHARAMEVHQGRLVLYGCGDLLDDYEGITGHAEYRPDLVLAYLPQLAPGDHRLQALTMIPLRLERLQLQRASTADSRWLAETLDRECRELGASVHLAADSTLSLRW
jgi:poly-gamma-glutamate synthesis protein (capsule biosynthesis protein)